MKKLRHRTTKPELVIFSPCRPTIHTSSRIDTNTVIKCHITSNKAFYNLIWFLEEVCTCRIPIPPVWPSKASPGAYYYTFPFFPLFSLFLVDSRFQAARSVRRLRHTVGCMHQPSVQKQYINTEERLQRYQSHSRHTGRHGFQGELLLIIIYDSE